MCNTGLLSNSRITRIDTSGSANQRIVRISTPYRPLKYRAHKCHRAVYPGLFHTYPLLGAFDEFNDLWCREFGQTWALSRITTSYHIVNIRSVITGWRPRHFRLRGLFRMDVC
ncbi:hypothetical protein Agabi119p4_5226 [Agaricus bisporus var. burnettii]|uniref:Uncharacterized protein n=1 Tax=Agaricus bisporus var. burnettii TaxID=192524 RepID=A0A8H7F4U0_AGABI|nr:hypothetical protein Agabi119p4_5226 [Agaricus bisporus var. burnettii]